MLATRKRQTLHNETASDGSSASGGEVFWCADRAVPIELGRSGRLLLQMLASLARGTNDGGFRLRQPCNWALDATGSLVLLHTRGPSATDATAERSDTSISCHTETLNWIRGATGLPDESIGKLLGVSRQALNLWDRGRPISEQNLQRLLTVKDILMRAAIRNPEPEQLRAWLYTPHGTYGKTPADHLAAEELDRARYLARVSRSDRVVAPPARTRRPLPEAFRQGAERRQEAVAPETQE